MYNCNSGEDTSKIDTYTCVLICIHFELSNSDTCKELLKYRDTLAVTEDPQRVLCQVRNYTVCRVCISSWPTPASIALELECLNII